MEQKEFETLKERILKIDGIAIQNKGNNYMIEYNGIPVGLIGNFGDEVYFHKMWFSSLLKDNISELEIYKKNCKSLNLIISEYKEINELKVNGVISGGVN